MVKVVIDDVEYVPLVEVRTDDKIKQALEIRFDSDVGENITVRDYLYKLLSTLWSECEDFSGKRPFGNSGWDFELLKPLIEGGFIKDGKMDEDGYIKDAGNGNQFVEELIKYMCYANK